MASAERGAYLDRRLNSLTTAGVSSSYDPFANRTTWTLPYSVDVAGYDGTLVVTKEYPGSLATPQLLTTTRPAPNQIAAIGNYTTTAMLIGILYSSTYRLSTLYLRNAQTDLPELRGRTQLRFLTLYFDTSTDFTVTVTTTDGRTNSYVYSTQVPTSGKFLVPIQAKNDTVKVTISSSAPGACNIVSYDWEGMLHIRDRLA